MFILTLLIFIFSIFSLNGQDFDNKGKPVVNFESPYNTVFVHLQYLNNEFYNPKIAGKTINLRSKSDSAVSLAVKLKRIYDGNGLIVNMANISRNKDYIDSASGLSRFIIFKNYPDIYLEKIDNKWLYSAHTARIIPILYAEMYPYSIEFFINQLPDVFQVKFLYLELWKWCALILLFVISSLLYIVFNRIIVYFLIKIWKKILRREVSASYLYKLSKPLGFVMIFIMFERIIPLLEFPITISYYFNLFVNLSVPVIITFLIYRITNYVSELFIKIAERSPSKLDDKIVPVVRKSLKILVVVFGGLYIVKNIGLDITPLLAGVSIGSLAIALAAQETIRNLFGSLTLYSDKVFEPGDWILAGDVDGSVEEVGIRSTRIRTASDSIIIVPNGKLADTNINNMGRRNYRRFRTLLNIVYGTPTNQIDEFIAGLKAIVANHPNTRKDYDRVSLFNLSDYSIQILFDTFFDVPDYDTELKARQAIISDIIKLAERLAIDIAIPSQTIYLNDAKK
ncbi:MAG TPA: mechanosensitive ion channel family protein [Candidatus Kapabacteria bacterium]|nr:mechanosensitive ion channel family protein [Candidatus Kapabacteria bacterium]